MFPANAYVIRLAGDHDDDELARLADVDSAAPIEHPILIGMVDGRPAAALDLDSGRAIADPFWPSADLVELLREAVQPEHRRQRRFVRHRRELALA